jgi:hypothetical protein
MICLPSLRRSLPKQNCSASLQIAASRQTNGNFFESRHLLFLRG